MEIALAILAISLFFIGYFLRNIHDQLREVVNSVRPKQESQQEEPKSRIVEALTPEQQAKVDLEERMKRLNA